MGRKMDDADVKKECPSCGLGVPLDAKICEFCGWDFNEEDEWILQIEKLERDLVQEKQNFEPGSVQGKIESSLHAPASVKKEQLKASAAKAKLQRDMEEVLGTLEKRPAPEPPPHPAPSQVTVARTQRPAPAPVPPKLIREAKPAEIPVIRPQEPEPEEPATQLHPLEPQPSSTGKVRRIRKVKGAPEPAQQPVKSKPVKRS